MLPRPRPAAEGGRLNAPPELSALAPNGILREKYRLLQCLGTGAHGVSYLAHHEFLTHPCVVKILPYRVSSAADSAVQRLRNEARAGFRVHHPNVVRVLDCDVFRGVWYFVMEYVDGVNLAELLHLTNEPVCWTQALGIARDAAQGLAAIHQAGLVHLDVKPGNLILGTDGRVRVADLGVASLAQDLPHSAGTYGTLAYSAPELFRPDGIAGPAADLYSLGATLYQLLTARLPHEAAQGSLRCRDGPAGDRMLGTAPKGPKEPSPVGQLERWEGPRIEKESGGVFQRLVDLQCRPVQWPEGSVSPVPEWFVRVILRLLAIDPQERFQSAEALLADLEEPKVSVPAGQRPGTLPRTPRVQARAGESLEPRGIGVLPFRNERPNPDDDWLGYAVANYLSRTLSEMPELYVVDQDGLAAMVDRVESSGLERESERIREAGRRLGAATVVTGRFTRDGARIEIGCEIWHTADGQRDSLPPIRGTLTELSDLEQQLFGRLAHALGLRPATPVRPAEVSLQARQKLVLGRQAFLRGDYEEAVSLGREVIQLEPNLLEALSLVGVSLARMGRYDEAARQHRHQEALARQLGQGRAAVEALANLGVMYYFRSDYESAAACFQQAARTAQELDLATEAAQIDNNLGFVLFRQGRAWEAEQAFLRAIQVHRAHGALTALVGPYNGLGNVLVEQGRYAEARHYYMRALTLAIEIGDRSSVGMTHLHIGRCAALERDFEEAKLEFTMALNALEETRFWNGLARAYEYVAEMHLQLGNYGEAIRCADKRLELARQHSNLRMEAAAWMQKAEALKRAGQPDAAAECLARSEAVKARSELL